MASASFGLEMREWRQIAIITLIAAALFIGVRRLPVGSALNHVDFRVAGPNAIDFCDPANPQFIPVTTVRSPVTMAVDSSEALLETRTARMTVKLATATGKPIAPEDLLVAHTRKLHLLIVDSELQDYQHAHPEPGAKPGEWTFDFTPRASGLYRIFADFTPAATGRGLYASADLQVGAGGLETAPSTSAAGESWTAEVEGCRLRLASGSGVVTAGKPTDLVFSLSRADGGEVRLQPVMGAYAHLVAFDRNRSGFAHLHPNETDLAKPPDAREPRLTFKVTIPRAGRYVVWAQVNVEGRELFAPFWIDVAG